MYLELFRLKELPFRLSPDPQFLYLSRNHSRAKAYMESTIWFTDGFVVITGEIGSGKTTIIESFLREIDRDVVVAQINQTQVSAIEFLQSLLVQFGFQPFRMKKAELLATLNGFFIEQYAAGRRVLLVVDEAQNLSHRVLEEIRLLSGVETTKEKVLRIILAGQPELNEKLDSPELVQLAQRVRLRFHLTALSPEDTRAYIQHRLDVAGAEGRQLFAEECFTEIFRYSGGVPRLINTLCDTAMMAAYGADRDFVTPEDIASAVEELQWVEFAARTHRGLRALAEPGIEAGDGASRSPEASRPQGTGEHPLARIVLASDGRTIAELPLRAGRVVIGRTPDNDLQLDSRFVSRHHCQIVTTAGGCVIEDLNSTNGMYVQARRVRRHSLADGDVVTIGRHELRYLDERRAPDHGFSETLPGMQPPATEAL
ncbi:MAG: AAA family ATPase [Gammaproteobacteria bacterium]|nr:AAA family ATPase [Gammaproteobacteria bacterium]